MIQAEISSAAFASAALRSERRRIKGVLLAFAALLILVFLRILLPGERDSIPNLSAAIAVTMVMAAYEGLLLRYVDARIRTARPVPRRVWYASILIEALFPTIMIILLAGSGIVGPYQALVAPVGLSYFLFVTLSTLRLDPGLSRATGMLGVAGYALATAYVYWRFPDVRTEQDFNLAGYATYGGFVLVGGVVAGGVAGEIRRHVAAALREADTRRQKEKLENDLDIARSVQQGLLPANPPKDDIFEVVGWNQPADQTGGDYYDWQTLSDGRIVVVLADVTGHGVGPALVTAACRAYGRATFPAVADLGMAMTRLNDLLTADLQPGKMVTCLCALADPSTSRVQVLSAGHGPWVHYRASDGAFQQFGAHGIPFGVVAGMPYGPPSEIAMAPGDLLLLLTDGFFEWANEHDEEFGMARIEELVRSAADEPLDQMIKRLYREVKTFAGAVHQADDLTIVIIRRRG